MSLAAPCSALALKKVVSLNRIDPNPDPRVLKSPVRCRHRARSAEDRGCEGFTDEIVFDPSKHTLADRLAAQIDKPCPHSRSIARCRPLHRPTGLNVGPFVDRSEVLDEMATVLSADPARAYVAKERLRRTHRLDLPERENLDQSPYHAPEARPRDGRGAVGVPVGIGTKPRVTGVPLFLDVRDRGATDVEWRESLDPEVDPAAVGAGYVLVVHLPGLDPLAADFDPVLHGEDTLWQWHEVVRCNRGAVRCGWIHVPRHHFTSTRRVATTRMEPVFSSRAK
ncbi:MAG: hypothetical protein KatS3mg131_0270 [Candidatus Tectimicrobiota bacterium]|nr:MAG: hypothetical protein KatS3mg131_0270 [Candidatus Tectomicrobia bacterium]